MRYEVRFIKRVKTTKGSVFEKGRKYLAVAEGIFHVTVRHPVTKEKYTTTTNEVRGCEVKPEEVKLRYEYSTGEIPSSRDLIQHADQSKSTRFLIREARHVWIVVNHWRDRVQCRCRSKQSWVETFYIEEMAKIGRFQPAKKPRLVKKRK